MAGGGLPACADHLRSERWPAYIHDALQAAMLDTLAGAGVDPDRVRLD